MYIIDFMNKIGFDRFFLMTYDRGARISHRIALDYPYKVIKMILLDIIPTIEHVERINIDFAMGYYHWFWLAKRNPKPESIINKASEEWFFARMSREKNTKDFFARKALDDDLEYVKDPETIKGIC